MKLLVTFFIAISSGLICKLATQSSEVESKQLNESLTIQAINDLMSERLNRLNSSQGCWAGDSEMKIYLLDKLVWRIPEQIESYDRWLFCKGCNFERQDTQYLNQADLKSHFNHNLLSRVNLTNVDRRDHACGTHKFSPLYSIDTPNHYIIQWFESSFESKSEAIVLVELVDGEFTLIEYIEFEITYD